jgi:hypothetical protein
MKRAIVIVSFVLSSCLSYGQEDNLDINGLSAGIVPTALFNKWIGYQAKLGYGFLDHLEVQVNLAYLRGKGRNKPYNGYRFRSSLRYYFLNDFENDRFYIEAGYLKRNVDEKYAGTFNMIDGAIIKNPEVNREKNLNGAYAMFGGKQAFSDSFWFEVGIGIGSGQYIVVNQHDQSGILIPESSLFSSYSLDGNYQFLILIGHFTIGYSI